MNHFFGTALDSNLVSSFSTESTIQLIVAISIVGAILVLFGLLFQALIRRQVSAKWLYLFWILIAFRFVLFAVPESPTSFMNLISQTEVAANTFADSQLQDFRMVDTPTLQSEQFADPILLEACENEHDSASSISPWQIAFWIWIVGVVYVLARLLSDYFRVIRLIRNSVEPSPRLQRLVEKCKQTACDYVQTRILVSDELEVPAMAGSFKPVVLVPRWCERNLDDRQMEMVLTHELVHVRRRDGVVQLCVYLISAVHWFNPLLKVAIRSIESARELSCDQRVVELFASGANGGDKFSDIQRTYGETILQIATRATREKPVCAVFLGGFIGTNKNLVKQRIAMLVQSRSKKRFGALIAGLIAAMLVAVGFTSAQSKSSPAQTFATPIASSPDVQEYVPAQSLTPEQSPAVGSLYPQPLVISPKVNLLSELKGRHSLPLPSQIDLKVDHQINLITSGDKPKVLISEPKIASLEFVKAGKIILQGIRTGKTSISVTDSDGNTENYTVNVTRKKLRLKLGETRPSKFPFHIPSIMISDPEVVKTVPVNSKQVFVSGLKYGTSTIILTDENGKDETIEVEVIPDIERIEDGIAKTFPGSLVNVDAFGGNVILKGFAKKEQKEKLSGWVSKNFEVNDVTNLVAKDHPIAIKVEVYEVSKKKMSTLGIDWRSIGVERKVESLGDMLAVLSKQNVSAKSMSFGVLKDKKFQAFIKALEKNAIAKLLDQPVLVTLPGKSAEFLSGGEVPIRVKDKEGNEKIEFRSFGTKINLKPMLNSDEVVTLEVRAEMSKLVPSAAIDGVPGFSVRRVNTAARMQFGKTFAVVGKYPDLDKDEKELLFLFTPRQIERVASTSADAKK